MTFEEMLLALQNPGEEGVAPTIYDDLLLSYNDGIGAGDAKVSSLNETIMAQESEISRLKAMNYDLLISAPSGERGSNETETEPDEPESGIDDLFATKE